MEEAGSVFGSSEEECYSGVSGCVLAACAAHIGDSTLRGRELWVAMTSRPDLLAIDMKRQGRFGLCLPLFPAQGPHYLLELFKTGPQAEKIFLSRTIFAWISRRHAPRSLCGHAF